MRIVRFALLGLGGLILLLAGALLLAVLFFDPNAHKAELQRLVQAQTGRELNLPGELKLRLYPWVAVELGRATLGNAAGFSAAPMVEIEHARLGVKLLPLLHGQLEIGAVMLDTPIIRLEVDAAGHNNWTDLSGGSEAETPGAAENSLPLVSVARVQIVNGTVQYLDRSSDSDLTVRGLSVETGALSPGHPFDLELAGIVQTSKTLIMELKLRARTTLDLEADRYQFASPVMNLLLKGESFPAAGLPLEMRFETADADLAAQTLKMTGMDLRLAGARFTGALAGTKILDAPSLTGPLQLADVSLREVLKNLDITLPATRDAAVFGTVGFSGTVTANAQVLMLDGLRLHFDGTNASGRAGISNLDTDALAFDLKLDRINADRYLAPPVPAGASASTPSAAATSTPIPVELLRGLDLHGTLNVGEAVFAGMQYRNLHVGINAGGGRLRIYPSEAQMYGGQYRGDIRVDVSGRKPQVNFDEHVTGVDFAPLFADLFKSKHVSGRGNGAIKATATGADTAALLRTLTGTLNFHVDNGAFEGTDLWYEIRRARALLKQQAMPARSGPARTVFTAVSATGRITNGVVANDDLLAALQYLQVKGRGTADIAAGTLDYHLDTVIMKIPSEGSDGAEMKDVVGLKIPVIVSGTFAAPKVRPDLEGLVKARVQQEIDNRKDEVKQKLQDKLQEKLKGLLGR